MEMMKIGLMTMVEMKAHDGKPRIIETCKNKLIQTPVKMSQFYDSVDVCPAARTNTDE